MIAPYVHELFMATIKLAINKMLSCLILHVYVIPFLIFLLNI